MHVLPLKRTDNTDVAKHLAHLYEERFGKPADELINFFERLNSQRSAVAELDDSGAPDVGLRTLKEYFRLLKIVLDKVVVPDEGNLIRWTDALNNQKKGHGGVHFELSSVAFNMAALHSAAAGAEDRTTPEGLKSCLLHLKTAMRVLKFVKLKFEHRLLNGVSFDVTPRGLDICLAAVQAQTQIVYYEKAVRDEKKHSFRSKLAQGVANFCSEAIQLIQTSPKGSVQQNLVPYFLMQESAFLAAAHYQWAVHEQQLADDAGEGYGRLIARLRHAQTLANASVKLGREARLSIDLTVLISACSEKLKTTERDNANIYLEVIPPTAKLEPLSALTAFQMEEPCDSDVEATSELLVPFALSGIPPPVDPSKNIIDLLDKIEPEVRKAETAMAQTLEWMNWPNLPSVDRSRELKLKMSDVERLGGISRASTLLRELESKTANMDQFLKELLMKLDDEEQQDASCRAVFGDRWARLPSESLNATFRLTMKHYGDKLAAARSATRSLKEKFEATSHAHRCLLQPPDQFAAMLDRKSVEGLATRQEIQLLEMAISRMQHDLSELRTMKQEEAYRSENVNSAVSAEESSKLLADRIISAILEVDSFVRRVGDAGQQQIRDEASRFIEELGKAIQDVLSTCQGASEGTAFYDQLEQYLTSLKSQVEDWLYAREEERMALSSSLMK